MPVEVIEKVGQSVNSGAPIYLVRCTLCGDEYRLTAERSNIAKKTGCSTCFHKSREIPGGKAARDLRHRRSKRIAKHLKLRGFRIVGVRSCISL